MDNKQNFSFGIVGQTFFIFSVGIIFLTAAGSIIGDSAKEYSTMYCLGSQGLAFSTILQFLGVAILIALLQKVLYSQIIFKKMMTLWRTVLMLFGILVIILSFVSIFGWFPVNSLEGWIGFFISFGVSFLCSTLFMILKTKLESKKYQDSFLEYKKKYKEDNSENEELY